MLYFRNNLIPEIDPVTKKEIPAKPSLPYMKKLMHCFTSLDAIFCNSVIDVPEIAYSLNMVSLPSPILTPDSQDKNKIGLLKAVVNIVNKTWGNKDLKTVIKALTSDGKEMEKEEMKENSDIKKNVPFHE